MHALTKFFGSVVGLIAGDETLKSQTVRLLSLLFLTIAACLSLAEYTSKQDSWWPSWASKVSKTVVTNVLVPTPLTTTWIWPVSAIKAQIEDWLWSSPKRSSEIPESQVEKVRFRPGFVEGVLALALVAPLYLRGLLKWKESIYSIISFALILLVFASFITIALGGKQGVGVDPKIHYALLSAAILSWLGIRSVAGASWLVALGSAVYSLRANSLDMHWFGFAFIASASLGLILHSGLNPGQFFHGLAAEYAPGTRKLGEAVRGDVEALGEGARSVAKTVIEHLPRIDG